MKMLVLTAFLLGAQAPTNYSATFTDQTKALDRTELIPFNVGGSWSLAWQLTSTRTCSDPANGSVRLRINAGGHEGVYEVALGHTGGRGDLSSGSGTVTLTTEEALTYHTDFVPCASGTAGYTLTLSAVKAP